MQEIITVAKSEKESLIGLAWTKFAFNFVPIIGSMINVVLTFASLIIRDSFND